MGILREYGSHGPENQSNPVDMENLPSLFVKGLIDAYINPLYPIQQKWRHFHIQTFSWCALQVINGPNNDFMIKSLVGGFKHFVFSPLLGEDSHFDYFSNGLKPPTR